MSSIRRDEWQVFTENRQAVIEQLEQGLCDGILPAANGVMDRYAGFCLQHGVLSLLSSLADPRARSTIAVGFFCNTLLYARLFQLRRLATIPKVLFRSPFILRSLGFNAVLLEQGAYWGSVHEGPFGMDALADFFAEVTVSALNDHAEACFALLCQEWPALFREGVWLMDCNTFSTPAGREGIPATEQKVCVLSVWWRGLTLPVLWRFASSDAADVTLGKETLAIARKHLPKGAMRLILQDRGFIDGAWMSELWQEGIQVAIGVRSNMDIFADMMGLATLPETQWQQVEPPQNHEDPPPVRQVAYFDQLTSWSACTAPLCGCLIRDTYPNRVKYQVTLLTAEKSDVMAVYAGRGLRWDLEEGFMCLTRYWGCDDLPPCRAGVARALMHHTLLGFALFHIYLWEEEIMASAPEPFPGLAVASCDPAQGVLAQVAAARYAVPEQDRPAKAHLRRSQRRSARTAGPHPIAPPTLPTPGSEWAVYAGSHFALFKPSEVLTIIMTHQAAWQANWPQTVARMRAFESLGVWRPP